MAYERRPGIILDTPYGLQSTEGTLGSNSTTGKLKLPSYRLIVDDIISSPIIEWVGGGWRKQAIDALVQV